jgi:hypothetical protein
MPKDMKSAYALAQKKDDRVRKEFEKWAILTYTNNRAVIRKKKGADGGVDGLFYFWNQSAREFALLIKALACSSVSTRPTVLLGNAKRFVLRKPLPQISTIENLPEGFEFQIDRAGVNMLPRSFHNLGPALDLVVLEIVDTERFQIPAGTDN